MKLFASALALALAAASTCATAHEKTAQGKSAQSPQDPALAPALAVVESFGRALKAADMETVSRLLHENVLVLESGGAERSREEYLSHHAVADSKFLAAAEVTPLRRHGRVHGDTAWVGSESELRTGEGSKAKTLLSTETMVLVRNAGTWRIVHIHWSSRPKESTP